MSAAHQLAEVFAAAIQPPDPLAPWEWAERNVEVDPTSPFQGKWRSAVSPWVRELCEVFADNTVEEISVMCSAQSAKTQTMLCLMAWALAQEPAPAMWVTSTGDEAAYFMKTRLAPTIRKCPPLRSQLVAGASALNKTEVTFHAASLVMTGSASPSKLQSKPVRWLFLDEVRNYPEGALEMVQKRTRAFWNSRTLIVSTPEAENDAVHRSYLAGDQRVWHYRCPACEDLAPLLWVNLEWDREAAKRDDGTYDFQIVRQSLRLKCPACGDERGDEPHFRRHIADRGQFVATNPNPSTGKVSFHWNALLPPWVSWHSLAEEFIVATSAIRNGDPSPLRDFVNESLGEPWKEKMIEVDDDTLDRRRGDYLLEEPWEDEFVRFMAVDVQGKGGTHYWYAIRAYAENGARSRLITYGKAFSGDDLLAIAKANDVSPKLCLMDSGYQTGWVMRFCQRHGWKPFRGDAAKSFAFRNPRTKRTERRMWTESTAEPEIGTRRQGLARSLTRYVWSNDAAKNLLAEMIAGELGDWTIPKNVGKEYVRQVTAEVRVEKTNARGQTSTEWRQVRKDNHLLDCELMMLVAAVATKSLGYEEEPPPEA